MTSHTAVLAHAQSGPVDLTALAFVGVAVAAAAFWLVRINRRLDAKENPMTEPTNAAAKPSPWAYAGIAAIVVLFAVGGIAVYRAQTNLSSTQAQTVVDDLCRAAEQAATDTDAALATFNGSPHNALHGIDTDLRKQDPIAAQRLATAKAAAETALIDGAPNAAELTSDLADQTAAAYRTLEPDTTINGCG